MKKRQWMSVGLAAALACSGLTGCKSSSSEAETTESVVEKVNETTEATTEKETETETAPADDKYEMKISTEAKELTADMLDILQKKAMTVRFQLHADPVKGGNAEEGRMELSDMAAVVTMDEKGNMKLRFEMDGESSEAGDMEAMNMLNSMSLTIYDNVMYLDATPFWDMVLQLATLRGTELKEEQLDQILKAFGSSAEEVKAAMNFSVPLGDLDMTKYTPSAFEGLFKAGAVNLEALLSVDKAMTVEKDSYTFDMNKIEIQDMANQLRASIEQSAEPVYDEMLKLIDTMDPVGTLDTLYSAVIDQVVLGVKKADSSVDDASADAIRQMLDGLIGDAKAQMKQQLDELKENRDKNIKTLLDNVKKPVKDGPGLAEGEKGRLNFEKLDDGMSAKMTIEQNVEGKSPKIDMECIVVDGAEEIKAPEVSRELSDTIAIAYKIYSTYSQMLNPSEPETEEGTPGEEETIPELGNRENVTLQEMLRDYNVTLNNTQLAMYYDANALVVVDVPKDLEVMTGGDMSNYVYLYNEDGDALVLKAYDTTWDEEFLTDYFEAKKEGDNRYFCVNEGDCEVYEIHDKVVVGISYVGERLSSSEENQKKMLVKLLDSLHIYE